ncbi:beta-N-acetylhexosaminidase [Vagococcus sp. PNs007]|uniref:Beta-N-acetylhexosaminidase n=1 Tax=Vagococcus proximus TaxID=2991417 RepID=A0ABT5X0I2_9ENTE|nr:beta-N-acetylhexosaminidase [Vagococcus proximus]MDF0479381.1 beta-N-acetylhexosaminidase [Vagococcus proximus]
MTWQLASGSDLPQPTFEIIRSHLEKNHILNKLTVALELKRQSLTITYDNKKQMAVIQAPTLVQLCRGLARLCEMQDKQETFVTENAHFEELNFMLEASRNAVMTLAVTKEYITILSLMGYTGLYLYIEDTYELPNNPYFGYLRGRYSKEELQEIVSYASMFGIEVVPCIQTLAHLTQMMKWESYGAVREDNDTLLIDEPQTYDLINDMLVFVKEVFPSGKVHIGMDEAYGVGVGQYLSKHEYKERYQLIRDHLNKVVGMCNDLGLETLVWSDFIYHTLDTKRIPGYYPVNVSIAPERAAAIPKNITYVYWDYGEFVSENYAKRIENHSKFADDIMFAGGIHIYGAMTPNHGKSLKTLNPALMTCKAQGVKKVLATTWGDNGQEVSHWNALPIMQWYAEHCYNTGVSEDVVSARFDYSVAPNYYGKMMAIRYLDEIPGIEELNHYMANPSKFLLWQDPLVGLFEKHVSDYLKDHDLVGHYKKMIDQLSLAQSDGSLLALNQAFYQQLAHVLSLKATLGLDLIEAYQTNTEALETIKTERLPDLIDQVTKLRDLHSTIWYGTYKPFGWEVLENRYGGLLSRLETTIKRLNSYLNNELSSLPELDEERLDFTSVPNPMTLNVSDYRRIAFTGYN